MKLHLSPRDMGILSQIADAVRCSARGATKEYASGLTVSPSVYEFGEGPKIVEIVICPCRPTMRGELVRLDLNPLDGVTDHHQWHRLLILEIEPFIMGVGQVRGHETPEGIVIVKLDQWLDEGSHDIRPPRHVAAG